MRYGRDMENLTTKERQLFHSLEGFMCMSRNSSATDVYLERFLVVFNFLLSIIASLGNLLILVALPKTCSLHSPSKILYRCLATTDFCVGVVAQPAFAVQLLYNNGERQELCYMSLRLCFCAGVILCGVSMTTLAALSVDRLLALLLTLRYRQIVTTARVRAVLGSFWITSAFVSTTYFWNDNVTTIIGCTAPFICLSISALSYAKMCQSLRRRHVQIACKDKNIPINIARYKKTVSTAIYIQLFFVVCYLPYGIVTTVLAVSGLKPSLVLPWASSYCLLLINSSINPFLYIWRIRDVRQAVKNTIRWNN